MWGISGYDPRPLTAVADLMARHGAPLDGLRGRRLDRVWSLRLAAGGGWCPRLPLVLDFAGQRLEVAVEGFEPADGGGFDAWVLGGLEFLFDRDAPPLQIFNGLDGLALANEDAGTGSWRRHDVPV